MSAAGQVEDADGDTVLRADDPGEDGATHRFGPHRAVPHHPDRTVVVGNVVPAGVFAL
jgi:hypothetical protein